MVKDAVLPFVVVDNSLGRFAWDVSGDGRLGSENCLILGILFADEKWFNFMPLSLLSDGQILPYPPIASKGTTYSQTYWLQV